MNHLITVQSEQVKFQDNVSLFSLIERKTFLHYLTDTEWPQNLQAIKANLLQSTPLSKEIFSNAGKH